MFDCIIIGGGIAGLQGAIQLGRYEHQVLVVDDHNGRSSICHSYHNILGWPDGISGIELRKIGTEQAKKLGVQFINDKVVEMKKVNGKFAVSLLDGTKYEGKTILLATGLKDNIPPFASIYPCLGHTVYVCPDCDGYEIKGKKTIVLGAGDVGANMALTLTYWSNDILYVNDSEKEIDKNLQSQLDEKNIVTVNERIAEVLAKEEKFQGVQLTNGEEIKGERGFIAYGGNKVKSDLAKQLEVEMLENKHIITDPRTKMTNIKNVWAAGDVVAHSEQVTIAMGEGSQAAIWIHKTLMENGTDS